MSDYTTVFTFKMDISSFADSKETARLMNQAKADTIMAILKAAWADSCTTITGEGETFEITKNKL